MNDAFAMEIFETKNDANYQKFWLFFIEFLSGKMISKISSWQVIEKEKKILAILMGIQEINEEEVFEVG